jgi:hypothetical protein
MTMRRGCGSLMERIVACAVLILGLWWSLACYRIMKLVKIA